MAARVTSHTRWAYCDDRTAATAPVRRGFDDRWTRQVDPGGVLPHDERMKRAVWIESRPEGFDLDWSDPFDPTTHTVSWADGGIGKTMITALHYALHLPTERWTPSAATPTDSSRNWSVHATSATSLSRVAGNSSDSLSTPSRSVSPPRVQQSVTPGCRQPRKALICCQMGSCGASWSSRLPRASTAAITAEARRRWSGCCCQYACGVFSTAVSRSPG